MATVLTLLDVAAERGAALLGGSHHTVLRGRQNGSDLGSEGVSIAAEDLRHGERGARHRPSPTSTVASGSGRGSRSGGLAVEQTVVVATHS